MKPSLENDILKIEDKKLMFKIRNRLIDVKSNNIPGQMFPRTKMPGHMFPGQLGLHRLAGLR